MQHLLSKLFPPKIVKLKSWKIGFDRPSVQKVCIEKKPLIYRISILKKTKRNLVMVKLKFIVRNKTLVLRISENKEHYYKSAKHLLKGNPNIDRHWNDDKERFTRYIHSSKQY